MGATQAAAALSTGRRWKRRPVADFLIRAVAVIVPMVAAVLTGITVSRLLPPPGSTMEWLGWYALILLASFAVLLVVDRLARRLLPLSVLLRLSLAFPDQVPSRLSIARAVTDRRRLAACVEDCGSGGTDATVTAVISLAAALNAHDRRTRGHSERVRALTELVAVELGLSQADSERLRWAAFLHDIGKLDVPAAVLNKRGRLDDAEWQVVQTHPRRGERFAAPLADWLGEWRHGIGQHHERYDGSGYPAGLAGEEISFAGRVVSVTDSFETMTAVRSYNQPMGAREARVELSRNAGTHFDPDVVRAFLQISLGRLRWKVGLAAWLAQLPFVGVPVRAAAHVATTAIHLEATTGSAIGGAAAAVAGVATPVASVVVLASGWGAGSALPARAAPSVVPGTTVTSTLPAAVTETANITTAPPPGDALTTGFDAPATAAASYPLITPPASTPPPTKPASDTDGGQQHAPRSEPGDTGHHDGPGTGDNGHHEGGDNGVQSGGGGDHHGADGGGHDGHGEGQH